MTNITFILIAMPQQPFEDWSYNKFSTEKWQYHAAAVGVLFVWILNMIYIENLNFLGLGKYITMIGVVSKDFFKLFLAIFSLVMAFATSMNVLFPSEATMTDIKGPWSPVLKACFYTKFLKMLAFSSFLGCISTK